MNFSRVSLRDWIYRENSNEDLGFHEIIPAELVAIFNEQELELLISGLPEIDVDDWKSNTEYHNYTGASPQIQWFWRAIRSFDKEERAKLLQFVTGTSKVPLNGFKELEGMNGFSRFNIHRDYGNKERLPSSHTCFNRKLLFHIFFVSTFADSI
jgi:E3 ubiquitin-protein ligase HUWE1